MATNERSVISRPAGASASARDNPMLTVYDCRPPTSMGNTLVGGISRTFVDSDVAELRVTHTDLLADADDEHLERER